MEHERRDVIAKLSSAEKAKRYIWRKFDRSITFDDIRELPDRFMYPIGFIVTSSYIFFFIGFAVYTFYATVNASYLAPMSDDGSGVCSTVSNEIAAASVLIDSQGRYEGNPGFTYSEAIYELNLQRFVSSPSAYAEMLTEVKQSVQQVGQNAMEKTLSKNLLTWLSWRKVLTDSKGNLQNFKFVADAAIVFAVYTSLGLGSTIQGPDYKCEVNNRAQLMGYKIGSQFDGFEYSKDSNCTSLLNMNAILYSGAAPLISPPNISYFTFDIRSFVVASSIHEGLFTDQTCNGNISHCLEVVKVFTKVLPAIPGQGPLNVFDFVDPRYQGMHMVECIQMNSSLPYGLGCTIKIGLMNAIPIFNLVGSFNQSEYLPFYQVDSDFRPTYCECGVNVQEDGPCQDFFFQMGLLVYNFESATTIEETKAQALVNSYNPTIRLLYKYQNKLDQLSRDAFNATIPRTSYQYSAGNYQKDFDFCYDATTNSYCTIISYEMIVEDNTLTRYLKNLNGGSCSNKFSISEEAWDNVISNPPVSLEQDYLQCRATNEQAIIESFGIALGNSQFWVPILAFVILFLYGFFERRGCIRITENDRKFSEKDKRIVADTLINEVLSRIEVQVTGQAYHERSLGDSVIRNANPQIKGIADAILDAFHDEYRSQNTYTRSTVLKYGVPTMKDITVKSPLQLSRMNTSGNSKMISRAFTAGEDDENGL